MCVRVLGGREGGGGGGGGDASDCAAQQVQQVDNLQRRVCTVLARNTCCTIMLVHQKSKPSLISYMYLCGFQPWVDKDEPVSVFTKRQDRYDKMDTHPRLIEHSAQLVTRHVFGSHRLRGLSCGLQLDFLPVTSLAFCL